MHGQTTPFNMAAMHSWGKVPSFSLKVNTGLFRVTRQNKIMGKERKQVHTKKSVKEPILIIQHSPHEHPAALQRSLESQGILTQWIHPYQGDRYPNSLSKIRGIICLGGPMGVHNEEEFPWLKEECLLLRKCIEKGLPTVGICLGGQLIAKAMGGQVVCDFVTEIGWFPIELNECGQEDPIVGASGKQPLVYHWHQDTFYLPKAAKLLASSKACPHQAFRLGDYTYGFQFHPEADRQLLNEWLSDKSAAYEIQTKQNQYGQRAVQSIETQIAKASEGENSSLKITAAIGQLFKEIEYNPVQKSFYDQLENWAEFQTPLVIEFQGSVQSTRCLRGKIAHIFTIPYGEFVIFKEGSALLWPVRLDHLKKVTPENSVA